MQIEVLGPIRLVTDGSSSAVRSSLQRTLLARLCITPNRFVAVDELVDAMWGVEGWEGGRERLWFHVSKLRGRLDGLATIDRSPAGYRLQIAPDGIDAAVFEALLAEARRLAPAEHTRAQDLVDQALMLWSGSPFEDVIEFESVNRELRRLEQLRASAIELRFDLLLVDGEGAELVGDLEKLVADFPFNDRFRAQLLQALWQSGRVSEARLVYEKACQFADEEFGGAVSPRIQEIIDRLDRGQSPTLDKEIANEARLATSANSNGETIEALIDLRAEDRSQVGRTRHLPQYETSFLGRDQLLHRLSVAAGRGRIVTLVGPAGVGKTRLAVETAGAKWAGERFDHIHFVDLVEATTGTQVAGVVAAVLRPGGRSEAGPEATIRSVLSRGESLVILDNCEHIIEAIAELVNVCSQGCPSSTWLATSRERLRLSGETVLIVEPLDEVDADLLLMDRARLIDGGRTVSAAEVRQISDRLDRLPLAIELAAQRLSSLTAEELLQGLSDRFELLTVGDRGSPPRQRTLRAALEWSLDQLDADHRLVFNRCAVFSGPFSVADAVAVCIGDVTAAQVRVAIANLVERSLVRRQGSQPPYQLLETMRHYGLAELETTQQITAVRLDHAAHFAEKVLRAEPDAFGPREHEVIDSILSQTANHRAALETLIAAKHWEQLAEYAAALAAITFWMRGAWVEPFVRLGLLAEDLPEPAPSHWSTMLAFTCGVHWNRGRLEDAERVFRLAVELDASNPHVWIQGCFMALRRSPVDALARAERAVAVCDESQLSQFLPSLWAMVGGCRVNDDRAGLQEAAAKLLLASTRVGSATGRCWAEVGLADGAQPGSVEAVEHSRRAAAIATTTRSSMNLVTSLAMQVAHLVGHDVDQARVVLLKLLRTPEVHDGEVMPMIAVQAAAAYLADVGDSATALDLAVGIPRAMHNPARSPEVQAVADVANKQMGCDWTPEDMINRMERAIAAVMAITPVSSPPSS